MVDHKEAQAAFDATLRYLTTKVEAGEATSADCNVLRQMLRDNQFQGLEASEPVHPMIPVDQVPFPPQPRAVPRPESNGTHG